MEETKICSRCKQPKPATVHEFRARPESSTGLGYNCRACRNECQRISNQKPKSQRRMKAWAKANRHRRAEYERRYKLRHPERLRDKYYMQAYGVPYEYVEKQLAKQKGRCAICLGREHQGQNWCLDHDHITGQNRGVLCMPCNSMIGLAKENPLTLKWGAHYLMKYKKISIRDVYEESKRRQAA